MCVCVCVCVKLLTCVRLFANPWTVVRQAPLVHGIFQARIFKSVAISFSRGPSQPRNLTCIYCVFDTGSWALHHWAAGVTAFILYSTWSPPLCPRSLSLSVLAPKWMSTLWVPLLSEAALLMERRGHLCHCFLLYVFETVSWLLIPCRWSVIFFHFILFAFSLISAILIWWH